MSAMIENLTPYPTREVNKIVRKVLKFQDLNDRDNLLVRVKLKKNLWGAYTGRAYFNVWDHGAYIYDWATGEEKIIELNTPEGIRHMIICNIGVESHYNKPKRHDRGLRGGPPTIELASWQEALVGIVAHESEHIRQFNKPTEYTKTRTKNGYRRRKKKYSEVECEWKEYRAVKLFREGTL